MRPHRKAYKRQKLAHRRAKAEHRTRKLYAMRRKGAARLLETREGKMFAMAMIGAVGALVFATIVSSWG